MEQPSVLVGMIPREKFLSTMPQASSVNKWDHRSHLQQTGHVGNLNRREKVLHHRKHNPWSWYTGMGTLLGKDLQTHIYEKVLHCFGSILSLNK